MEERRRDYPNILDSLKDIKTEMTDTRLEARKIATLVEERNLSAIIWRGEVCKKFDKIFGWLETLPCKEREARSKTQQIFDGLLWGAIGVVATLLFIHLGWK